VSGVGRRATVVGMGETPPPVVAPRLIVRDSVAHL
jgi:hypothetical protein